MRTPLGGCAEFDSPVHESPLMTTDYAERLQLMMSAWDWETFRREAAKDILAGMMSNVPLSEYGITDAEVMAEYAVLYAEKLIKRLKEGEK